MTYELFWAGEPHTAGTGFWVETLEPFYIFDSTEIGRVWFGQGSILFSLSVFRVSSLTEAMNEIHTLNSQLEAYRSKQLSLNIKGGKR